MYSVYNCSVYFVNMHWNLILKSLNITKYYNYEWIEYMVVNTEKVFIDCNSSFVIFSPDKAVMQITLMHLWYAYNWIQ